ncbi:hypothetical protein F183_A29490 [Bryobacterales bacterium F-183]|nr:hypothetical protein F183_A29490 [Bryobacterales bacterium F-183]
MTTRFALLAVVGTLAAAQTVPLPNPPPFDPNDPEGFVEYPNKTGRYVWKRKGTWTPSAFSARGGTAGVTPAARQSMLAVLDSLSAMLRATPEGSQITGWFMKEPRSYFLENPYDLPPGLTPASVPIIFEAGFYPFYLADTLIKGAYKEVTGGETEGIYFTFNRLPEPGKQPVIAQEQVADRGPVRFFLRPDASTTYAGFPVLDGQELVIARPGRDPFAPAPYGRVLRAAMAEFESDRKTAEQRLAGLKAKEAETLAPAYEQAMRDHLEKYSGAFRTSDPKKYEGRLAGMERELRYNRDKAKQDANPQRDEAGNWYWHPMDAYADAQRRLASMSPAEAAAPACFVAAPKEQGRYKIKGQIVAGVSAGCHPIVIENYAYFDPKLPRHVPQILTAKAFGRCFQVVNGQLTPYPLPVKSIVPPQGCARHVAMWSALDWKKVAGLLAP